MLNNDGRIYHLNLVPEDIGSTIFLVGDPARVQMMSSLFDKVEIKIQNREFHTHTGYYNGQRISVISTGIGTDNIDIVLNELDALVNINLKTRSVLENSTALKFIRVGTSGSLKAEIEPGDVIVSTIAGGLDNLLHFYKDSQNVMHTDLNDSFRSHMNWQKSSLAPYFVSASPDLEAKITANRYYKGITLSAPGFYGPQGRALRMPLAYVEMIEQIQSFSFNNLSVLNLEMESSAIFGLSKLLGHEAITLCLALANRETGKFLTDYKSRMKEILAEILDQFTSYD